MGLGSGLYKALLVAHLLTVIVGIGGVALNGVYGARSKGRRGPDALAFLEANYDVTLRRAEPFIYAILVTGLLLVWASDGAWSFGDTWVWLSLVLYVVTVGISHGVIMPTAKRRGALMRGLATDSAGAGGATGGPKAEAAELDSLGQRTAAASAATHLLALAVLVLMVWKP